MRLRAVARPRRAGGETSRLRSAPACSDTADASSGCTNRIRSPCRSSSSASIAARGSASASANDRPNAFDRRIRAAATRRATAPVRPRSARDRATPASPPARTAARAERARELERIKRIAAARLVDAKKLGPRQRDVELRRERRGGSPPRPSGPRRRRSTGERTDSSVMTVLRRPGLTRDEHAEGLAAQAAKRELEHGSGRRVQPLSVVDRDEHGAPTARAKRKAPRTARPIAR